jgi:hypothetical protein
VLGSKDAVGEDAHGDIGAAIAGGAGELGAWDVVSFEAGCDVCVGEGSLTFGKGACCLGW